MKYREPQKSSSPRSGSSVDLRLRLQKMETNREKAYDYFFRKTRAEEKSLSNYFCIKFIDFAMYQSSSIQQFLHVCALNWFEAHEKLKITEEEYLRVRAYVVQMNDYFLKFRELITNERS